MIAGKSKFDTIAGRPGTVKGYFYLSPNEKAEDDEVLPHVLDGDQAEAHFRLFSPAVNRQQRAQVRLEQQRANGGAYRTPTMRRADRPRHHRRAEWLARRY
jgi:hypothetical protein